jgi:hypothetical protein
MSNLQPIITAYTTMRAGGIESNTAFRELYAHISVLDTQSRDTLIAQLREWETHRGVSHSTPMSETETIPVKPLKPLKPISQPVEMIACPNCGKKNRHGEVICYSCGVVMVSGGSAMETNVFDSGDNDSAYFSPNATLVLVVKGTKKAARIRPQSVAHDLVLGRSGGAMAPDVDLNHQGGAELGVSRMHVSIRYEQKNNALLIADLDSANGTFVNGQRLHPREVRVLRHGDELRLARLVLLVYFQQSTDS